MITTRPPSASRYALPLVALLCAGLCQETLAQNLLPNPGFEDGAGQPSGWRSPEPGQGEWSSAAHQGQRALLVKGNGKDSHAWRSDSLALLPGGLYRLSYQSRSGTGASGGCAMSGTGLVNRDFHPGSTWQRYGFVFAVPSGVSKDFVRFGQWEVNGSLSFDDAELLPVQATHFKAREATHVWELGEAERIENGTYHFTPNYGWAGANYHRPLWVNRATFNSDRWVFSPGAEVIYRFHLPGLVQTNGQVNIQLNYYTAGTLRVEASRDGQAWERVADYDDKHRGGPASLPGSLFPAEQVFLRLRVPGPEGNLQVNSCDYQAGLETPPRQAYQGKTVFLDVLQALPDFGVTLLGVDAREGQGAIGLSFTATNRSARSVAGKISLTAEGLRESPGKTERYELAAGAGRAFSPRAFVEQPGQYRILVDFSDQDGRALFRGRVDASVSPLYDARPGHFLAGTEAATVWWCESGWKIGVSSKPPERPTKENVQPVTVSAARGEDEPAQVLLYASGASDTASLEAATISPFLDTQGAAAPISVRINQVAYVQVTHPTDETCEPDRYPDPLPPLRLPAKWQRRGNLPLWLTFHVPREARAGDYTAELALKVGAESIRVPLAVHVHDFELPRETHLRSALGLGSSEINRYHKLTRPEDQQLVYEKYLANFAAHRISPYSFFDYAPIDIRFAGQGTNKQARVDFTKFDTAAARWLDGAKFNSFSLPLRGMGGGTFQSRSLGSLEGFKEGTPEFARLFRDYLSQVEQHLRARGWLDQAYTYWFDEPDRKDYEFVVEGMKRIRAAAPGLRRLLTEQPEPELLGHVEIWCGLTPEWTPQTVAARRAAGEEVWWYICCGPKAPFVTEFIDHPGTELRLWPWQSWQYGVEGILIWATTYWSSSSAFPKSLQDPWADPMSYVSGYDFGPGHVGYWGNGDGRFLYPPHRDPNSATAACLDDPISSVRWENLRDGMEDYEYFWLLDQAVKKAAAAGGDATLLAQARALLKVPDAISTDLTHFTTDPRLMLEHREKVARMIERLQKTR